MADTTPDDSSTYVFGRNADDRQRLQYQFELLREDHLAWFDAALRRAGLATKPERAAWSVLDAGCGEGQYAREVACRYPHATVTGLDVNPSAIEAARAAAAGQPNLRFLVHDIREPVPAGVIPGAGFDVAVGWMVLLHLPDKAAALAHLAAALRPGAALLLGNAPDEPIRIDQPDAVLISTVGLPAMRQIGALGLERDLPALLRQAGFGDVDSAVLRYLAGGVTAHGQRWYRYALSTFAAGRRLVVDICGLMDGTQYDRHLEGMHRAPVAEVSGEVRFLVTVARRS